MSLHIVNGQVLDSVNTLSRVGVWSRIPRACYRVIYPCADRGPMGSRPEGQLIYFHRTRRCAYRGAT